MNFSSVREYQWNEKIQFERRTRRGQEGLSEIEERIREGCEFSHSETKKNKAINK